MKHIRSLMAFAAALALLFTAALFALRFDIYAKDSAVLYINAINVSGAEGHSLIYTPKKGANVGTGETAFCWWRSATFEWSDEEHAYIVRSVDLTADGYNGKNNYIPQNGFVLLVNIGNDYGNINYINKYSTDTYNALASVKAGDKAYLAGIDLENGKIDISSGRHYEKDFVTNARIYINEKPEDVEIYEPDISAERLPEVELDIPGAFAENGDIAFSWQPVEGAEYYIVNVNTASVIPDGHLVCANAKTSEPSFKLDAKKLTVGNKYTVSVTACAQGKRDSFNARSTFFLVSERAADSPFIGKTVVAFGDSLTAITGWVAMLAGEIGTDVINSGVGGDKTTEAVSRLKKDVIEKEPDIVLIMFGMNDQAMQIASNTPLVGVNAYERNYRRIIDAVLKIGAEPVLMTCNNVCTASGYYSKGQYGLDYGTGNIQNYFDVARKLAAEYGINLIDINSKIAEEGLADTYICAPGDGIHLSKNGQECFTRWISDYLYNDFFESIKQNEESSEEPAPESSAGESAAASEEPGSEPEPVSEQISAPEEDGGGAGTSIKIIIGVCVALVASGFAALYAARSKKRKQ
ncbi:MAG: hypothetical protein IJK33_04750 [Clostridia bacterium]|nr:hypothetical protein [Clostridia bacterium]